MHIENYIQVITHIKMIIIIIYICIDIYSYVYPWTDVDSKQIFIYETSACVIYVNHL
jgi:hypothetical protein